MSTSAYRSISSFGSNAKTPANNPLSYCLTTGMDNGFLHGSSADVLRADSKACQAYLSEYCAQGWDGFCEVASKSSTKSFPNNIAGHQGPANLPGGCTDWTAGDILVRNTASKKYLKAMAGCKKKYEPFDPNVASSPMVSYWISDTCSASGRCIPVYAVDPTVIDDDPVMNKILEKPYIAPEILLNIFNTMNREGTFHTLQGTKLGFFFDNAKPYSDLKRTPR